MRITNAFSTVSSSVIARVRNIAEEFVAVNLPAEARSALLDELNQHEKSLLAAFDYRKKHGPERGGADSDVYFKENLGGMISFVRLAVDPATRGGYTPGKIVENVDHYAYLVARLLVAEWKGSSSRKVLKGASIDNSEALKRLANR